jgi:hypothetical protein
LKAALTRNQVELMRIDTTASENLPGFRALAISPRALEGELEAILSQTTHEFCQRDYADRPALATPERRALTAVAGLARAISLVN